MQFVSRGKAASAQVYRKEHSGRQQHTKKDASDPQLNIQHSSKLWSLEGQTYDTWISKLTHTLLSLVHDPTLSICQHMVFWKAALAELMLPHILADLAEHDADQKLMLAISSRLTHGLLNPDAEAPVKPVQLILTCLHHLRNIHLDAVLGLEPSKPQPTTPTQPSQGKPRSRSTGLGLDQNSPLLWLKSYWLDIDYLLVAKAAMKCRAPFTALLYTEHWLEAQHGRLVLDDMQRSGQVRIEASDQSFKLLLPSYSMQHVKASIVAHPCTIC